jgi:hypothetical protein
MKKGLLLVGIFAVLSTTAANAQRIHYGLKAGLLFSTLQGKGLTSSFSPGFQGGAYLEWDLSKDKKWGIQPELLFTQAIAKKGTDFSTYYVTMHNSSARDKIKFSSVTVPLLVRYSPTPALTFNLGAQYSYAFYLDENLLRYNQQAVKRPDIGAVAGLQVNVGNVRFFGRYVLGLTNINDIDDRYTWKSQQISIGIGVGIK